MLMDPKLTGFLSRALSHEMRAVQQYLTQSVLCSMWGLTEDASTLRKESEEELEHAERLIRYMLGLGLLPNRTQLSPVRAGRTLREMLVADWEMERDAVRIYTEASRYSSRIQDSAACQLFTDLLHEEQQHLELLQEWIMALDQKEVTDG